MDVATILRLAGSAMGTVGGVFLFVEFFQLPDYINYDAQYEEYTLETFPEDPQEYSPLGRVGSILVALAFALLFVATLVG